MTEISGIGFPPWTGWVPLAFGLLFLISAAVYEIRFVVLGKPTIGTIDRFERIGKSSHVYIKYQSAAGQNEQCRQCVLMREHFSVGQQVNIRYLPDDPSLGRITTYFQLWQPLSLKLILGTLAVWAALWIFGLRPSQPFEQERDRFMSRQD